MRRTTVCALFMVLLGGGVLVAPPALAAFGAVVELPGDQVYSPYGGPVTVTFIFDESDDAEIFTVRLREPGKAAIRARDYLIDPTTDTSPHDVSFAWAERSVEKPTEYEIDVRPQRGGAAITSETFTLLPKLVSDVSMSPTPFYPLINDGYKDRTRVGFSLSADTAETVVHVYSDEDGRCCGTEVRTEDLGSFAAGDRRWSWDGKRNNDLLVPKGTYFVKVEATDLDGGHVTSRARKVVVTTATIRRTASRVKAGSAFERAADEVETARGGSCIISRDTEAVGILCFNAAISVYWKWSLKPGERIESVGYTIETGYYPCNRILGHTGERSYIRVSAPPSSGCRVTEARIKYSYPVKV